MKRIIIIALAVATLLVLFACGSGSDSGSYTVDGINDSVTPISFARNDQDGVKVATIAQNNLDPADFAVAYYNTCFGPDDVAHYIENLTTKTSTEIRIINGQVFVTVREYVDGEEHDGELAGSGMVYKEYLLDPDAGTLEELK